MVLRTFNWLRGLLLMDKQDKYMIPNKDGKATVARKIHFCYGHRVWKHESKCAHLHGHNGVIWVYARAPKLDKQGRVIDFSILKEKLGNWIDKYWDHGFIYHKDDKETEGALMAMRTQKMFPLPYNPTAENLSKFLVDVVCPELFKGKGIEIYKIEFFETENCIATYELP